MGLAKRLAEVRDDMKMVVKMLRPDGEVETFTVAKKEVEVVAKYDGTETFWIPRIAALDAFKDYKVISARVKDY